MSDFAKNFLATLNANGLTRADLSRALSIRETTMRSWLTGAEPSVEVASKIADYLGVSLDYLIAGKSDDFFLASDEKKSCPAFPCDETARQRTAI